MCTHNQCLRAKKFKYIVIFHPKMNIFTAVKYCCILHGRVCPMLQIMYADNINFSKGNHLLEISVRSGNCTFSFYNVYGSNTHYREVPYYDVINSQISSLLALSGDTGRKLTFQNKNGSLARIFNKHWFKYIPTYHAVEDHVHKFLSCIETRQSS